MKKTCVVSLIILILLTFTTVFAEESSEKLALSFGTNLSSVTDYGSEFPFNDFMKLSRSWLTKNNKWISGGENVWDTKILDQIPLDEDGYPLELPLIIEGEEAPQVVHTVWAGGAAMPKGEYTLLYDGEGEILFSLHGKIVSSQPGKIILNVKEDATIVQMQILKSTLGNHIRNIRIYPPGVDEGDGIFNQVWMDKLDSFETIRFMDWGKTNNNDIVNWEDRPLLDDYTYTGEFGVPYEMMIQACNELQKDMWICIPHKADDEYIRNMAILIRDNLDENLEVYVEYSNETWNWMFTQTHYLNDNGDQSKEWPERIVPFIQNSLDIFSDVFENDMHRLNRVVGTQHAWIDVSNRIASNMRVGSFDVLSPAAYFGLTDDGYETLEEAGSNATAEMVIESARDNIDSRAYPNMLEQVNIANRLGVELAFYEGGQHLTPKPFGTEQPYGQALVDVQNTREIYDLYTYWFGLLSVMDVENGENIKFVNFAFAGNVSAKYGCWGIFENIYDDIDSSYKYKAISDYINSDGNEDIIASDENIQVSDDNDLATEFTD